MNEILTKIQESFTAFNVDAALQCEKGNKASLDIEKLMKEFRKISLEESKK